VWYDGLSLRPAGPPIEAGARRTRRGLAAVEEDAVALLAHAATDGHLACVV
jgi:hypothetical protein